MNRAKLNQFLAAAPVALSILALVVVLVVLTSGWERSLKDEGAAAHIFQLLVAVQLPLILVYLATANWNHWRRVFGYVVLQIAAVVAALAPVAYFRL